MGPEGLHFGEFLQGRGENEITKRKNELIYRLLGAVNQLCAMNGSADVQNWAHATQSPVICLARNETNDATIEVAKLSWQLRRYGESTQSLHSSGHAYISYGVAVPGVSRDGNPDYLDMLGVALDGTKVFGRWRQTQCTGHEYIEAAERHFDTELLQPADVKFAQTTFDAMQEGLDKIIVAAEDLYLNPPAQR